jgi:diguanylate cyclase (GGDEF)-like protein
MHGTSTLTVHPLELRVARLERAYIMLRAINAAIVRIRDRTELFDEACRVAVIHGGFRMAWIGLPGTSPADAVFAISHAGDERGFLSRVRIVADPGEPSSRGVTVAAVTQNRTAVDNDTVANVALGPLRDVCAAHGFRSAIALPLRIEGKPVAALVLYAGEPDRFDAEETKLLEELAADISLGMAMIGQAHEAQYLASHDPLTGLPNRERFIERIVKRVVDHSDVEGALAVMVIDLNRFRSINDSYGFAAGDEVLRAVAERLHFASPANEPPARIGADAFGLVLSRADGAAGIVQEVDRILAHTFGVPIVVEDRHLRLSAKAGVALYGTGGRDAATLFRNAEAARERAQESPEPFLIYAPQMNAGLSRSLATENRLRHGMVDKQFVVHYQPKVDAHTGAIVGAEALLRWNDPENGLVAPHQFVTVLEETGLIIDAGRFVLLRVMEDVARWRAKGLLPPRIAVNVSVLQLRRDGFVGEMREIVNAAGGHAAGLDVEITESALMADVPDTIEKLDGLRELGVEIAIDDFGTGYSSLNYLVRLPATTLKIDRSFVVAVTSEGGQAIMAAIINLAHNLRFKVVAEGVETEEQAQRLRELACDQMQGFLFHGVLPGEAFEALLAPTTGPRAPSP